MDTAIAIAVIGGFFGLVGGVLSIWATLYVNRVKSLVERHKLFVEAYESKILEQRIPAYKSLWSLTKPSSRHFVDELSAEDALKLWRRLTDWYYNNGGMYMSETLRDAFFEARSTLDTHKQSEDIVDKFSALRTALCNDLNSRDAPSMTGMAHTEG